MNYKVGIISDTHDILREEIVEDFKDCQYILHAGDIIKEEILQKLTGLSEVVAVKGNNDNLHLNEEEYVKIGHYRFYIRHQLGQSKDVDFYIFGHSHQYTCYKAKGVQYLNPGSCGRKRFSLGLTYAIIYLGDQGYRIERKDIV